MFEVFNAGEKITKTKTLDSAKNAAETVVSFYGGESTILDLISNREVYSTHPGAWWRYKKA